jgi:hypothetical protein
MGGDDSQKLLPWRGIALLSGAQQPLLQQNQHSSLKATRSKGVPSAATATIGEGQKFVLLGVRIHADPATVSSRRQG